MGTAFPGAEEALGLGKLQRGASEHTQYSSIMQNTLSSALCQPPAAEQPAGELWPGEGSPSPLLQEIFSSKPIEWVQSISDVPYSDKGESLDGWMACRFSSPTF